MKTVTITNIVKKALFVIACLATFTGFAQEEEEEKKKFYWGGSVDAYFRQNLSAKNDTTQVAPPTAFANDPGFAIGMVNLIAGWEGEKVGFKADLVFGPRGEESVFLSGGSSNSVNQLYVYWNVSKVVTLTLGNFNTYMGYEVISPVDNYNYSTSYMFSYGPFSHTGIKADFTISERWSALAAIMNSTDFTEFNPDNRFTFGWQVGYSWNSGSLYFSGLHGKQGTGDVQETTQLDIAGGFDFSESFYLGLNTSWNDTENAGGFFGAAIYPQYSFNDKYSIGLRAEYFSERDLGVGALGVYDENGDANVWEFTLSGNLIVWNDLKIIPEIRIDTGSEDFFEDRDADPASSLSSVLVAAVYSF